MSSAAVQQQLNQCRQEIVECEANIAKLKNEIEFIETVRQKRIKQQNNAYASLSSRKASVSKYDGFMANVNISKSFGERMRALTNSQAAQSKAEAFGELASMLKRTLLEKEEELERAKAELVRLQNRCASLEGELQHWLRVEEEQRRAEAERLAAEAQNNSGGR